MRCTFVSRGKWTLSKKRLLAQTCFYSTPMSVPLIRLARRVIQIITDMRYCEAKHWCRKWPLVLFSPVAPKILAFAFAAVACCYDESWIIFNTPDIELNIKMILFYKFFITKYQSWKFLWKDSIHGKNKFYPSNSRLCVNVLKFTLILFWGK